jgi:hypothetical protein
MQEMAHKKNNTGLQQLPPDERDYQLGAYFLLPKTLPKKFSLNPPTVKDQGDSDLCSCFSLSSMAEMMDGVEISPLWAFAVAKMLTGEPESWGLNMRDAFKVWTKYGAVPEKDAEYKSSQSSDQKIRYYGNWVKAYPMRFEYGKGSFWSAGKTFEEIKQAIYKFKQPVAIGVIWRWNYGQKYLREDNATGGEFGHMMFAYGWEDDYLKIQNSWGTGAGSRGRHCLHKDVINKYAPMFGAMTWSDLPADRAKYVLENELKESQNWASQLLQIILSSIKKMASKRWLK